MSGVYWGLTAMDLMSALDRMRKDEVLHFVELCQHDCGGFSASTGHDPHLLYTLSAIQVHLERIPGTDDLFKSHYASTPARGIE